MNKKITLLIDAFINLVLGILLLAFSPGLVSILGVPPSDNYFYPNILGAVLSGIGIALIIEAYRKHDGRHAGLGLVGAITINICGGLVLLLWLLFGGLDLPLKGLIFLWILDILLLVVSILELFIDLRGKKQ
jgi:hypothetical protein